MIAPTETWNRIGRFAGEWSHDAVYEYGDAVRFAGWLLQKGLDGWFIVARPPRITLGSLIAIATFHDAHGLTDAPTDGAIAESGDGAATGPQKQGGP